MRRHEGRVLGDRGSVAGNGLLVAAAPLQQVASPVPRLPEPGVEAQRGVVLDQRAPRIADALERRTEVDAHRSVLRLGFNREPVVPHRLRPVEERRGVEAAVAVRLRRLDQPVERPEQRVGHADRNAGRVAAGAAPPPTLQVVRGAVAVPHPAVGHGEGIVDDRCVGDQHQRCAQVLDGACVVPLRQGGPAELEAHDRLVRVDHRRLAEVLRGLERPGKVEQDAAEPDERGQIAGLEPPGALEARGRGGEVAGVLLDVSQVVGPAGVAWGEPQRVLEAARGLVAEAHRHEHPAQLAPGIGLRRRLRVGTRRLGGERRVGLDEPLPDGGVEGTQIR